MFCPCETGAITVDGVQVPGLVRTSRENGRVQSSAFVTEAEVWAVDRDAGSG